MEAVALLLAARLLPVELVIVLVVLLLVVPFDEDSGAIGMSTLVVVVVVVAAESRSSRGEMRAALDLTGDTMEPIGEAEVADTDEEGGVEVGADKLAEDSGLANRTPSYWTPLNSIVTTSFWSPLLASPRLISLNCIPEIPSGELKGSVNPVPVPPNLAERLFFEWCNSLSGVKLSRSPFSCFRSSRATRDCDCNCLW